MARDVVLATVGSAGDVLPLVSVGSALLARGHRVTLAANPAFRDAVEGAGLELLPTGTAADLERIENDPGLWSPTRSFGVVMRGGVLPAMRPVYEHLAGRDPARTVVAASLLVLGARLARERLGLPLVGVHLQPAAFLSAYDNAELGPVRVPDGLPTSLHRLRLAAVDRLACDAVLARPVNRYRASLGLPPVRRVFGRWAPAPEHNVGLFPGWFAPARPDWPANIQLVGFVQAGPPDAALPAVVERFLDAGEPPVVVTFGSSMHQAAGLYAAALAACARSGRRAVVLTRFRDQLPTTLPPGVLHASWVPMLALLRRSRAVVHHGGIGTVAHGLAAGVPQLVVPLSFDQPDNANRLVRLGVAERLDRRRFTPGRAAAALDRLDLRGPPAGSLASRVDLAAGADRAAEAIAAA